MPHLPCHALLSSPPPPPLPPALHTWSHLCELSPLFRTQHNAFSSSPSVSPSHPRGTHHQLSGGRWKTRTRTHTHKIHTHTHTLLSEVIRRRPVSLSSIRLGVETAASVAAIHRETRETQFDGKSVIYELVSWQTWIRRICKCHINYVCCARSPDSRPGL